MAAQDLFDLAPPRFDGVEAWRIRRQAHQPGIWADLQEPVLRPDKVNVRHFGKLDSYPAEGSVFVQPLYVPSLSVAGGIHNALYIATMNDRLYAFDADHPGPQLWLCDFILRGGNGMPAYRDVLSPGEIRDLLGFLHLLQSGKQ